MSRWVVDTAPLIFLAKLQRLDLLRQSADEVIAPPAVLREVEAYRDAATVAVHAARREWLTIQPVQNETATALLLGELDAGEAEAIVLAREVHADRLVLDALDARRYARRVGIPIVGTVGLLLAAKLRGDIGQLRPELERLATLGFRIHQQLVDEVLSAAGEAPTLTPH